MIGPVFDNLNERCDGLHHRDDFRRSHRHFRRPALQEGMAEGQDTVALAPGDRAGAGNIKIAAHQHPGQRLARLRVVVNVVCPAGRHLHHVETEGGQTRRKSLQHAFRNAGNEQWRRQRFHRRLQRGQGRQARRVAGRGHQPLRVRAGFHARHAVRYRRVRGGRIIGFHFEHVLDGRDADQRLVLGPEEIRRRRRR